MNTARAINVLVVDDHPVVRSGIRHLFAEESGMTIAAEASSGAEAMELLGKQACDAVILDLALSAENGLEVLEVIKACHPTLPVLILSMYAEEVYALAAMKAGASGYLCKDSLGDLLVTAVKKVASGGKFITPTLAEQMAVHLESRSRPLHETLSSREVHVMRRLARGLTLKAIADELCLSTSTVGTYKARVFQKMGFETNADLIRYVMQNDLMHELPPIKS